LPYIGEAVHGADLQHQGDGRPAGNAGDAVDEVPPGRRSP
jgi:hypothetical protein